VDATSRRTSSGKECVGAGIWRGRGHLSKVVLEDQRGGGLRGHGSEKKKSGARGPLRRGKGNERQGGKGSGGGKKFVWTGAGEGTKAALPKN